MAALGDFARLGIFYNGNWLEYVTSISATWNSGQQRVDLLNEGIGGYTPGSGDVTIEVGFVIPIGGLEDDYPDHTAEGSFVDLQVPISRKSYIGRGKIETCSVSQSVNAAAEGTFTWTGELKPLE